MIQIIKKLFCLHKWYSHAKERYEWTQPEIIKDRGIDPIVHEQSYLEVNEILICEKCGEIKKIEY